MENYDVVIEKTVRDLFKSSNLNQIKKYKYGKDKEISKKDEELRNLILDKYPILVQSISSLEQISNNLNEFQTIRNGFNVNIEKLQNIDSEIYKNENFIKNLTSESFSKIYDFYEFQEEDLLVGKFFI